MPLAISTCDPVLYRLVPSFSGVMRMMNCEKARRMLAGVLSKALAGRGLVSSLFRCEQCELILSVSLEDDVDVRKVQDRRMVLECPCGGHCHVLPD